MPDRRLLLTNFFVSNLFRNPPTHSTQASSSTQASYFIQASSANQVRLQFPRFSYRILIISDDFRSRAECNPFAGPTLPARGFQRASRSNGPSGIEPGSQAWEACMIPLHYLRRCDASRLGRSVRERVIMSSSRVLWGPYVNKFIFITIFFTECVTQRSCTLYVHTHSL
jgi:hypothetical protein